MDDLIHHPLFGTVIYQVLILWPFWRIMRRAGMPSRYGHVLLVPVIGPLLGLIVLSHVKWPNLPPPPAPRQRKERKVVA